MKIHNNAAIRAWADSERETPTAGMVECSECEHLASPVLHCTVDGPCHGTGRVRAPCATCGGTRYPRAIQIFGQDPDCNACEDCHQCPAVCFCVVLAVCPNCGNARPPCPDCTDGLAPRVGPEIDLAKWDGDVDLTPILKPACGECKRFDGRLPLHDGSLSERVTVREDKCKACRSIGHGPPLVDVLPVRVPNAREPSGDYDVTGLWEACREVGVTLEVREAQSSSGAAASPDSSTTTGSDGP